MAQKNIDNLMKALSFNKTILASFIVGFGYFGYKNMEKRELRKTQIEEVENNSLFKARGFKLAKYADCVLSEEMVLSGRIEKINQLNVQPQDIFVASFPKSGTTWLQQVVYLLLDNNNDNEEDAKEIMEWKFPYLEHIWPGIDEIDKRIGQRRLIKTHLPLHLLPKDISKQGAKVIYIYRNPKDVIVSYYHFAKMLTYAKFEGSLSQFAWMMMKDQLPYCPFFSHIHYYLKASKSHPEQYLVLNYESMKKDPKMEIQKVAKFLNVEMDEEKLEFIAQETSFDAMKKNPSTNYKHWDKYGLRDPKESEFLRKGQIGDFKNHFTPEIEDDVNFWINIWSKKYPEIELTFT